MWNYALIIIKDETYEEMDIAKNYDRSKLYGISMGVIIGIIEILIVTADYYGFS